MPYGTYPVEHVLIPWITDDEFSAAYQQISSKTLLPITKCYLLHALARHVLPLDGSAAECGVYKGGTAHLLASLYRGKKKLYLFDSFCGIPPGDPSKDNRYIAGGDFADTSLYEVMTLMSPFKDIEFRPGIVPDTFVGLEWEQFSFVHIDLDIYSPILEALRFFYPRMSKGGVIVLDDYGAEECQGAYLAVEEFCASIGRKPISLPTGQAMIIYI
jgi:O-methyltransferase